MKRIFYIVSIALFQATIGFTQQRVQLSPSFLNISSDNRVKELLQQNIKNSPNNTQLAIAIIDGDNTKYLGIIRKNDTLFALNNKDNIFEIGSITKVFNSVLLSQFVFDKKVKLEETLQDHFDFTIKNGDKITLQNLVNHTAGFPKIPGNMTLLMMVNPNNPYKNYTPEYLEQYLKGDPTFTFTPGTKNLYSNLGTGLLGYILTKKSGKSYEELLQKFIFKPLEMYSSSTTINPNNPKLVRGRRNGKVVDNWDFTDALVGAGGIKSSVVDMEKFIRKNFENDVIYNLPQQQTFSVTENLKIGLGWHMYAKKDQLILWHNGATGGYRSCMTIIKNTKKAVVVLSNISAFQKDANNVDLLCFKLLKLLK